MDDIFYKVLDTYLQSHFIDVSDCRSDSFDKYFIKRAIVILDAIENATGKAIPGRDSEETRRAFGGSLAHEPKEISTIA